MAENMQAMTQGSRAVPGPLSSSATSKLERRSVRAVAPVEI